MKAFVRTGRSVFSHEDTSLRRLTPVALNRTRGWYVTGRKLLARLTCWPQQCLAGLLSVRFLSPGAALFRDRFVIVSPWFVHVLLMTRFRENFLWICGSKLEKPCDRNYSNYKNSKFCEVVYKCKGESKNIGENYRRRPENEKRKNRKRVVTCFLRRRKTKTEKKNSSNSSSSNSSSSSSNSSSSNSSSNSSDGNTFHGFLLAMDSRWAGLYVNTLEEISASLFLPLSNPTSLRSGYRVVIYAAD